MLHNWLEAVPDESLRSIKNCHSNSFGHKLVIYKGSVPNLKGVQIALIGVDNTQVKELRKQLYPMYYPFERMKVADLGNLRNMEISFAIPLVKELLEGGILPILIAPKEDFTMAQFGAYHPRQLVNLAIVDEKLRYSTQKKNANLLINRLLQSKKKNLLHLSAIGIQNHLTPEFVLKFLDQNTFDYSRLGRIRQEMEEIEPLIRDADFLSFNLAALRMSEAPGIKDGTPSGLFPEEACQISRYAGMSDKLSSIGFYGFRTELDRNHQTAMVLAQMLWYFLDGYYNRKNDFPASIDGMVEYIVEIKGTDNQLVFWKSSKSGRWWMQVPVRTKKQHQRHKLVPCSYNDYLAACQSDLSERLLNAYKRFK